MRAETIRALEVRKNSVMAERRKSAMQTLGAKNEYGIGAVSTVRYSLVLFRLKTVFIWNLFFFFYSFKA